MKPFRLWLQNMWYEHREEVLEWTGKEVEYTSEQYFAKYKWFLRTLYKNSKKEK
jgi:hypothetical protein